MVRPRFAPYAWGVVLVNLAVIAWGAFVRASKSGAGCGSHWPLCNGTLLPQNPAVETVIEFAHRVTSGTALLLVVGLVILARRDFPPGHLVRRAAWVSLGFIISEALVGAGLVLLELVASNDSAARAVYLGVHLANTLLLLAALSLTAWWGSGHKMPAVPLDRRRLGPFAAGLAGLLVVGVTGAVTALGDTLFPAGSLAAGLAQDSSPTAHILLRLRVLHPVAAVSVGLFLSLVAVRGLAREASPDATVAGRAVITLVFLQLTAGGVNLLLLAPTWMQLVHLFLADLVWISAVLLTASVATESARVASASPALGTAIAHQ